MKKLLSIFLTALMLISIVIISVGAINSDSTKPESISMTVYDVETGEETVEEYQIDTEIIKALSSKSVNKQLQPLCHPLQFLSIIFIC